MGLEILKVKTTQREKAVWELAAKLAGLTLAEWARQRLLGAAFQAKGIESTIESVRCYKCQVETPHRCVEYATGTVRQCVVCGWAT